MRLDALLGPRGPLAAQLPGFSPRPQQIALARAVEQSLVEGRPCLAEAGTGIGKTLAYLVPLVRWLDKHGGRAVVSTHTLALQAQLVERDIPTLLAALPRLDIRAATLKGRANFLCLHEMDAAAGDLWTQGDAQFAQIRRWAQETNTGDVAELPFAFRDWSEIAANADTCRQRECRHFERCFFYRARKHAEDGNLLVVNHALFFADLRLKRTNPGGPTLIPPYDAVVLDEAHHVDETATRAFGLEWGSRRVPQLVAKARRLEGIDTSSLAALESLNQLLLDPFLSAPSGEAFVDDLIRTLAEQQAFADRRSELGAALDAVAKDLARSADNASDTVIRDRAAGLARTATRLSVELSQVTKINDANDDATEHFRWYQTRRLRSGATFANLVKTPLTIDKTLRSVLLSDTPRVVFASATLASGGSFAYLKQRLGLCGDESEPPVEIIEGSPFDYEKKLPAVCSAASGRAGGRVRRRRRFLRRPAGRRGDRPC